MRTATLGQLLINEALPAKFRNYSRVLDKDGSAKLFQSLAEQDPEAYKDALFKLSNIGRETAYLTGGNSFGPHHLRPGRSTQIARQKVQRAVRSILSNKALSPDERREQLIKAVQSESNTLTDALYRESLDEQNPLAYQVLSGSRGNPTNLRSLRGFDGAYEDHHGDIVGLPILRNYSEGLSPAEYWASTYGARKGVLDTKMCLFQDTEVLMADMSVKRIADIKVGDMVFGATPDGKMTPTRVLNVFNNGWRECYKWLFRIGSTTRFAEVVATDCHKILSQIRDGRPGSTYAHRSDYTSKLRPLGDARLQKNPTKNTFIAIPSRGVCNMTGRHEPLALLYGLLMGDGCCTRHVWALSCADTQLIEDTKKYLATFNYELAPPKSGYSWRLRSTYKWPKRKCSDGKYRSGNIHRTRLKELGVCNYAHAKTVSRELDTWDDASVLAFLGGLYSTDGCVEKRQGGISLRLYLTARPVVEAVRRILELRFGIWCGKIQTKPVTGNMKHEQYGFIISHQECVRRFANLVPLVGVKRHQLLDEIEKLKTVPRNAELGFKIQAKEYVGDLPTYDIEVEHPEHMFVLANGLIVSNSVAKTGFLAKQLAQLAHRLLVVEDDDENDPDNKNLRGLPVPVTDNESVGALLAIPHGKYARNTVITPKILRDLQQDGYDDILIRSPIVGRPASGGVYAKDVGIRERGRIAPIGDYVGIASANALSEKLTQGALGSKHSGGIAGAGPTGFALINSLIQVPETFPSGATHAQLDGHINGIIDAPQGGKYILINGQQHYVPPDMPIHVKDGDEVEAGDVLTGGVPDPSEIVKYKGIGEGGRYFAQLFRKAYKDSKIGAHRRNIELVTRGLIDHVRLNDMWGDYAPDDVIPYHTIEQNWEPRTGSRIVAPKAAVGQYLEKPVLHYTIGTQIKKSMLPMFNKFGVNNIYTHNDPPPFEPEMQRAATSISTDPDWQARMIGSGQKTNLLEGVYRGDTSDSSGTSYVPTLVQGTNFGKIGPTKGWSP